MAEIVAQNNEGITLATSIAQKLREDVLSGHYSPGTRIRLEDIKSNFGVSWSPIREAITRLVTEGLIVSDSQKSYRVAPASKSELIEAIELRVQLETKALKLSIEKGDDAWEIDVVSAQHRLSKLESQKVSRNQAENWEELHQGLHFALTKACESPILLQFCHQLNDIQDRYRRIFFKLSDFDRDVAHEHKLITDATLNRNVKLASKLLADHIERTGRNILAIMPHS